MVKLIGMHRSDDSNFIHYFSQMRQFIRKLRATLSMARKGKAWAKHGSIALNKSITLIANHRRRQWFTLERLQLGFVIKELQLARCARLKEMDHPLGFRGEMRAGRSGEGVG